MHPMHVMKKSMVRQIDLDTADLIREQDIRLVFFGTWLGNGEEP